MSKDIKYIETGIPYCPKIPNTWEVKKLKFVGKSIIGITYNPSHVTDEENGILVLRSSNIQNGILNFQDNVYVNLTIQEKHLSKEGDILICARNGSAHLVGKSAYIPKEYAGLTFGAFMLMFRSNYGKFMFYVFNSNLFRSQTGLFTTSTINQLTTYTNNNLFVALPKNEKEQQSIATYLDRKTTEIDNLISKKQKLIECLKEERMAIINQAVTKGIDPNAEMKDSCIEWLGEIPKHWEVKKLKYLLSEKLEYGANESAIESNDENPRYLRISDFDEEGKLRRDTFKSLPMEKAKDFLLKNGDILFARSGATVGKTFIFWEYEGKACFAGYLIKARPNLNLINPLFLYLFTKSNAYENWKNSIFNQSTIQNIGADKYCDLEIPFSSPSEQSQIVSYIESETSRIDTTISKIEQEIELIKEYRTALINEVVTGKKLLN